MYVDFPNPNMKNYNLFKLAPVECLTIEHYRFSSLIKHGKFHTIFNIKRDKTSVLRRENVILTDT